MPLLLKDATKFALRGKKRQRSESEDVKGTALYPVYINDESYDLQLVPSGSTDVQVAVEPKTFEDREGHNLYLVITEDLYEELLKLENGCSELMAERHPNSTWQSALHESSDKFRPSLKVKFYDNLQVFDEKNQKIATPKFWRNAILAPIINIKAWANENGAGLCFNMVAVKLSKREPRTYSFV